jgi:hypothetical protein
VNRVRTTLWPDRVLEVDDAELLDLQRQGLLLPGHVVEQFEIAEEVAAEPESIPKRRTTIPKKED